MLQHESLHLTVVSTAPVRAGKERPADLNNALLCVVTVVARRANDLPGGSVESHQRTTGTERILEESPERGFLIAVSFWMLLPDQRIRSNAEQRVEVVRPHRAQLQEISTETWLAIE